jgi:chemotaxis protein histidine kinase CheA
MPETAPAKANSIVIFDKIQYDVIAGPANSTPLVQVAKEQLLETIEINKMVRNLNRTNDLLHIAACGVAGFVNPKTSESLSAQIMALQKKLRDNTGDMQSALLDFGLSAETMLPILKGAFKDLYDLYEDDCIDRLKRCEKVATEMAATASGLKNTFQGLADEAQRIAEATTLTRDLREKAREAAVERQKEIEAQEAETKEIKKQLEGEIVQTKAWYEEAKANQATAEGRVFALAIVGSITKALGDGLAAGLQFKTAPVTAGAQLATALANSHVKPAKKEGKKPDKKAEKTSDVLTAESTVRVAKEAVAKAEQKHTAAKAETEKAQKKFDKLEGPYEEAEDAYKAAKKKKDAKAEKTTKAALDKLKPAYVAAEEDLEEAKEDEEEAETALEAAKKKETEAVEAKKTADKDAAQAGVAAGLSSAGASATDASSAQAEIAANYAKERAKLLDSMMKLQEQERTALGAIARFAVEMSTQKGVEQLEKAAVESLHIAVGVLKHVVVILQDVTQFWTQMALGCRRLASDELRTDIEVYKKRDPAKRIKEYSSQDFQLRMLGVAAQWHGLKLVAAEYHEAVKKLHGVMGETYKQNLPIEEARAEAKRLAKLLDDQIKKEITQVDGTIKQIEGAKEENKTLIGSAAD